MLIGSLVDLRAVEPTDFPLLCTWHNDNNVMKHWGRPGNTVSLSEVAHREQLEASRHTSRKYIICTKSGEAIGQIDYYDLDWQSRSAWISILIGNEQYWGGGYGTDALRTLLDYLFRQLNLHRITLTVHDINTRARRAYRKSGFVEEGVLRDWAYFDGRWVNGVIMSVLAHEFMREDPAS